MDLSEIRAKIDVVDDQLLDLFLQRMALAEDVGRYKDEHHLPILNKTRERELTVALARVGKFSRDDELNCGACGYKFYILVLTLCAVV